MQITADEFARRRTGNDARTQDTVRWGAARTRLRDDATRAYAAPGHPDVDVPFDIDDPREKAPRDQAAFTDVSRNPGVSRARGGMLANLRLTDVPRPVLIALLILVALATALGLILRAQMSVGVVIPRSSDVKEAGKHTPQAVEAPQTDKTSDDEASQGERGGESVPLLVESEEVVPQAPPAPRGPRIAVHVAGAVTRPGVYELPETARIQDALDAAGGALPEADVDQLNLAERVADGEKVRVPLIGEQPEISGVASGQGTDSGAPLPSEAIPPGLVNINTASAAELEALPGVGPSTAQAIVDERASNGPFATPDDLMRVSGIGEKKYAKLQGKICV